MYRPPWRILRNQPRMGDSAATSSPALGSTDGIRNRSDNQLPAPSLQDNDNAILDPYPWLAHDGPHRPD